VEKSPRPTPDPVIEKQYQLLLVDRDAAQREIISKLLRFHGSEFIVDVAVDSEEAIRRASRMEYDLVVFCSHHPDFDGFPFLHFLHKKRLPAPVLYLLDEHARAFVETASQFGVNEYFIRHRGYLTALPFVIRNLLGRQKLGILPPHKNASYSKTNSLFFSANGINSSSNNDAEDTGANGFVLDRRGRFLSAEAGVQRLTAYTPGELLELTLMDLIPNEREWDFYDWIRAFEDDPGADDRPFVTPIQAKYGRTSPIEIRLLPVRDRNGKVAAYSGEMALLKPQSETAPERNGKIDQQLWIEELLATMTESYSHPANVLMERLAELTCRTFKFRRATIALLDRHKHAYLKHVMIGTHIAERMRDRRSLEVPEEIIERIFAGRFRIKVVYYSRDYRQNAELLSPVMTERRTQRRRPAGQWHPRDLILINLCNGESRSFGYISLDDPLEGHLPTRDTFQNLEVFSRLASTTLQNYFTFAALSRRARRLKQVLVTSNIFKLYLSLNELLREIVWAVKFSLEFNVAGLALISQRSGLLEMKAVACEDKIKTQQLLDLKFNLASFSALLRREYARGKSFYVTGMEPVLQPWKQIYYGSLSPKPRERDWPSLALLLVPLKSREGKIIGFLMVDDPSDASRPDAETVRTLEILANQIAVALENRILYLEARRSNRPSWFAEKSASPQSPRDQSHATIKNEARPRGVKRLIERLWP
jgi:PAS domain S-box-containing protein